MEKLSKLINSVTLMSNRKSHLTNSLNIAKFEPCLKVRASVVKINANKTIFITRNLKFSSEIEAIEWNASVFPVLSIKTGNKFCTYTVDSSL